jgi:Biotin/lipoate A/B protein ligase family
MALDAESRVQPQFASAFQLPPPFHAVALREVGDAFAHAIRIAPESGAGTLVHVGRFDVVEFAVVLEPEEPLRTAKRALYAGLVALADALSVYAPPEKPISFEWPDAIRINGGLVGGARLAWPTHADEDEPPPWLVFGAMIAAAPVGAQEPGLSPLATTLDAEGFDVGSGRLLEGFARHLMVTVNAWQQDGFDQVARSYLSRLASENDVRCGINDNGDLLMHRLGHSRAKRRSLVSALATPTWFDPATGGPILRARHE